MRPLLRSTACLLAVTTLLVTSTLSDALACTRLVYFGANDEIITARSMDWEAEMPTDLWILPRGIARTGIAGPNSIAWTAKYGSVVATAYDIATADGVNEKGLMTNLLWLAESEYPPYSTDRPALAISLWAQYVLDNFATVDEAVSTLETEPFLLVTDKLDEKDGLATLHLSMSDASGDSAIVEYVKGKQVIHHGKQYQVMTNSPTFDAQRAIDDYWQAIGGTTFLPGTNRASDRFARASFYVNAIPKFEDADRAVASVFSVIRNVSVPLGISTPNQPNISSTRWRTVFDHKRGLYFFESALTPNTFWVDLRKIDFSADKGEVKELSLGQDQEHTYAGDATGDFVPAKPFTFLGLS